MKKLSNQLWIEKNGDIYTIGMTDNLQFDAGDITYASIASLGSIDKDDTLLNIEASKAAIEVPAPFSGEIIERNEEAENNPTLLGSKEKAEHWIVKMNQVDPADWDALEAEA